MRILTVLLCAILLLGVVQLAGQRQFVEGSPQWEIQVVLPREVTPARYVQVTDAQLQNLRWPVPRLG